MAEKIFIIDDELDILEVLSFRLKNSGYQILSATDGKAALDLLEKEIPDLILLDLRLPVIDGYELCRKIKSEDKLKQIPIILITASGAAKVKKAVREFNVEGYMIKPFDYKELIEMIQKILHRKEWRR